jgi:hypothetical protein
MPNIVAFYLDGVRVVSLEIVDLGIDRIGLAALACFCAVGVEISSRSEAVVLANSSNAC